MTQELVTGFAAAKILNKILVANDRKPVPPQFIYQYMGKGYITSYEVNGKKFVDLNGEGDKDFGAWLVGYLGRKGITVEVTETVEENKDQVALF
jgi:hypothetical protein